jgi:hydroxyacylglutathione hydrolase
LSISVWKRGSQAGDSRRSYREAHRARRNECHLCRRPATRGSLPSRALTHGADLDRFFDNKQKALPTPGHNETHVAFYDERTGILFSGDFLLPGRLLIDDAAAYRESALRVIDFLKTRSLTHILGGHIELNTAGRAYRFGSHYHPNEHRLELAGADLTALPAAFERFNGFYARYPNYILTNPVRNLLALAVIAVAVLIFVVWGLRRLLRRRRS